MPLQGQGQVLAWVGVVHELSSVSVQTWSLVPQSVSQCHVCNWQEGTGRGYFIVGISLWVFQCPECVCMARCVLQWRCCLALEGGCVCGRVLVGLTASTLHQAWPALRAETCLPGYL